MKPRIALCPKCHTSMTPGERFCRNCGAVICPNCQELLPQRSRYCPKCGFLCLSEPVKEVAPPVISTPSVRRTFSEAQTSSSPAPQPPRTTSMAGVGTARVVCPQCGSAIDLDSGRCTGCGLLFGARHRVMQAGTESTPVTPRHMPQPYLPKYGAGTPSPTMPPRDGGAVRHSGSGSVPPPVRPPKPVHQAPVAPAMAEVSHADLRQFGAPAAPGAQHYRFREAVREIGAPQDLRQTLLKLVFTLFVLFVLLFAGTGLYYLFSHQGGEVPVVSEPSAPPQSEPPAQKPASLPPPAISDVGVSSFTDKTAVITWKTDKPATSQVRYGKTEACGLATEEAKSLVTEHSVRLGGLEADTTYYFRVISKAASGEKAEVAGEPFKTKAAIPVGTNAGNRAPDFTLKSLDGKSVTLSELQGNKVLLNFWATWCEPCKKEMPYIQAVHEAWRQKGVVVLAVAVNQGNQSLEGVKLFIQDNKYTFTVVFDSEKKVAGLYQVSEIPKTVFIDADGIVRQVRLGEFANQQEIEDILSSF